jgi:hypothetical protein
MLSASDPESAHIDFRSWELNSICSRKSKLKVESSTSKMDASHFVVQAADADGP